MTNAPLPCLVEESLGKQWFFALSGQQTIEYSQRDKKWSEPSEVDGHPVKLFGATIDSADKIHLVAYNTSKQLVYYEFDGREWYQKMLHHIASRFENITFIEILSTGNDIHVFYYIENSLKRAEESLVHSYLKEGKWNSEILLSFLTEQVVVPQLIRSDNNGNMFCIYTRTLRSQTRCYYIYFDSRNDLWSKPTVIFQRPGKCSCFNADTDSTGNLHMVWVEAAGSDYRINYVKVNPSALNHFKAIETIQETTNPIEYPCVHVEKDILCLWIQNGSAKTGRKNHSEKFWEIVDKITTEPVNPYNRIYKSLDGKARIRSELGDGYPDFKWTLDAVLHGNKGLAGKTAYDESNSRNTGRQNSSFTIYANSRRMDVISLSEHVEELKHNIMDISKRLDEFYTALYQIQDYIRQKDKSWFQMEAQVRKIAFEVEQIRNLKSKIPRTRVESEAEKAKAKLLQEYKIEMTEEPMEQGTGTKNENSESNADSLYKVPSINNVDTGSGEIQLGNVSILINPEDDHDTD